MAIGASTSGFLADLFMYKLEKRAIATFICPPSIWKRYVDDTFAKLKKVYVLQFMEHLNSQHERIEFTSEELVERKLAMLDKRERRRLFENQNLQKANSHRSVSNV